MYNKVLRGTTFVGLVLIIFAVLSVSKPMSVEAGWLDAIGAAVLTQVSGGKVVNTSGATQKDKALFLAIRNNDYALTEQLIKDGANVNAYYEGAMPMDYALAKVQYDNNTQYADLLIKHGADIEGWYKDNSKHYYAFIYGNNSITYLLNNGLNPKLTGQSGITLLMVVLLTDNINAGNRTRADYLQSLVNMGVDVNAQTTSDMINGKYNMVITKGNTALMMAAYNNYTECAKILLYAGAKKNVRNSAGKTAMDIAIDRGYTDMIKVLYDY